MKTYQKVLLVLTITVLTCTLLFTYPSEAQNGRNASPRKPAPSTKKPSRLDAKAAANRLVRVQEKVGPEVLTPSYSQAVAFVETPAARDIKPHVLSAAERRLARERAEREKNEANVKRVKPDPLPSKTADFWDPTLVKGDGMRAAITPRVVTNPISNFDGPDADTGQPLFGGRFAPPDTNGAVGPNHVVVITNMGLRVYDRLGTPLTPQFRLSQLLVGIPNAADDDGDPVVLYDSLADRWIISQFNLRVTNNSTHQHIAVSKTGDPTGAYYAYDFLMTANRPADYPHMGVWPDGYYMSTNDFSLPVFSTPFQGAGLYAFERAKMLVGDPTAKVVAFNTNNQHGGMLPTNFQGYTPPPAGTPNLFIEFDADEFGAATDLIRTFAFHVDYAVPANSTLTQGPDIPTIPFDARSPATRAVIQQPAPGEGLDNIADRLMHALNFRVLPGGVQSYVLNFTVNVSGVNPTSATTYQGGVRWMELRRNPGTGVVTINQEATYAPGSGNPTGRDLWMAAVGQDGEGNIALAASASAPGPVPAALNPTAIYTGRLAGDPLGTLPQGEVDALAAVSKGVQISNTFNRWGDYSSLFIDPVDDCTFWGAFEYVDTPNASFDWNTRIFSFKVNPNCVTPQKGNLQFNVTNCETGLPIDGASIVLNGNPYGATTASGSYTAVVPPGTYNYSVSKTNFSVVANSAMVTNGNTTVVNVCLQGVPSIAAAGSTITAESCQPPDNALSPGETVTVNFGLKNNGGASTANLVGTLQATGGVTSPSGPQNYGAIPPDNTTVVSRAFTFTVDPQKVCGDTVTATLQLQDGANNLGTVTFTMQIGAPGAPTTATYSTGNIATPIPDVSSVDIPISVPDSGVVDDINVKVRLNHTFDGDLVISLVHPDGTVIPLSTNRGGSGDNYGSGANDCSGTHTVFDDSAATAISAGAAPFAGTFRPESPLSALNGKPTNGTWKLRIADTAALDTGTVGCVQLELRRFQFVCCGVAGTPEIQAGNATLVNESCPPFNTAIDPGERVTIHLPLTNVGTGPTGNLVATLQTNANVQSPSAAQSYGALTPSPIPGNTASRDFSFTAVGDCGATITATWQLQDGMTNLGTVSKQFVLGSTSSSTTSFTNANLITIPAGAPTTTSGPASPYPSTINVAGLVGTVSKVTVTLTNMNHTFPDDIDVLLVGPGGQKILLMSDAGGSADLVNNTYTFDDAAAATLADGALSASGTYKPSNFGTGDTFPAPAPAGPYTDPQLLSVFNGVNPNGTWSLYVVDDVGGDVGNINGGWTLNITTSTPVCTTPCGMVRLLVNSTLVRINATTVKVTYTISNTGTATANNVVLTTATLGPTPGTPLPQNVGSIAAGATSAPFDVFFNTSATGNATLTLGGNYTGGTFSAGKRVTIP